VAVHARSRTRVTSGSPGSSDVVSSSPCPGELGKCGLYLGMAADRHAAAWPELTDKVVGEAPRHRWKLVRRGQNVAGLPPPAAESLRSTTRGRTPCRCTGRVRRDVRRLCRGSRRRPGQRRPCDQSPVPLRECSLRTPPQFPGHRLEKREDLRVDELDKSRDPHPLLIGGRVREHRLMVRETDEWGGSADDGADDAVMDTEFRAARQELRRGLQEVDH